MELWQYVGAIAGFCMPLFNIPLIFRIVKRKSAGDLSLFWLFGVWTCILLMSPAALMSQDIAFRLFGWTNLIFFTVVVVVAAKYHKGQS
ncbi:MAG: hypothetical protein BWY44_01512 [Candidatus Omnitrophica bacterium ADurb.Bin292]|jgi:uncharacterized protein with PQ loop repeat|nr:MAG: hypothetical protein BWY44_01512 [Candidatus Omnitrophica bacterium ADurb.Bin292]HOG23738.1 hypothetical protein [Candidatus Omnitrophota bacterium]HPW76889.1 hypothetical protein [Candidatus Omnitrophota bacterium]HQB11886.1 hypothetical protein [Candidatus Omnitrophota bacterium]